MPVGKNSRKNVSKARRDVFERDRYQCITGGIIGPLGPCSGSLTIQHRVGRGMGGSAQYDDTPAYLLTLCLWHNQLETMNADARKMYESLGWSVPRWVMNIWTIEEVPVCFLDSWAFLVGNERVGTTPQLALERMGAIYGGLPA